MANPDRANAGSSAETLDRMCRDAVERYGVRVLDNIDPWRLPDAGQRARVIGKALMDKGGLEGFKLGRRLLDAAGEPDGPERPSETGASDPGAESL